MSSEIHDLLQNRFRLNDFRPGQLEVIETLLAGRSSLAVFPTGGGKSLCYQLPALLQDGLTLVVSPLIALMKDQVDMLCRLGIEAARLDSSLELAEIKDIFQRMRSGQLKLLYVAPERLSNERFIQSLEHIPISLLAIDEAHCISEWGHNFRPDYLKLAHHAETLGIRKFLALTATATPQVSENICQVFAIESRDHVQTGFYRPNLSLHVTPCESKEKDQLLYQRLSSQPNQGTIVYVTLQKTAESVAEKLVKQGINAQSYHAGMKSDNRSAIQEAFMSGETSVIVATIAFGMGIDKSDIRAVYHYNLPKSLENYVQEVGRAGRDGLPSSCEMFISADDCTTLLNFTYGDTPSRRVIESVLSHLLNREQEFQLNAYQVSNTYDIRPLVLNTLLTYLELDGFIQHLGAQYETYQWKWIEEEESILNRFQGERSQFLEKLFQVISRGRIWCKIDCEVAVEQTGEPRERIVKALTYFEEQGWIELKTSGVRQRYRTLKHLDDQSGLIDDYTGRFERREQQDERRLAQVIDLVEKPGCIPGALLTYFGEDLEQPCNQCSDCLGQVTAPLQKSNILSWTEQHDQKVRSTIDQYYSVLKDARAIARLLCGLSSPSISKARLSRKPEYGSLDVFPFKVILSKVSELV